MVPFPPTLNRVLERSASRSGPRVFTNQRTVAFTCATTQTWYLGEEEGRMLWYHSSLTFLVFDDRGTVNQAMGYSIGEVARNKIIFAI